MKVKGGELLRDKIFFRGVGVMIFTSFGKVDLRLISKRIR